MFWVWQVFFSAIPEYSHYMKTVLSVLLGGDEIDEISAQELFEDKLKDVIDGLTQKR